MLSIPILAIKKLLLKYKTDMKADLEIFSDLIFIVMLFRNDITQKKKKKTAFFKYLGLYRYSKENKKIIFNL